MKITMNSLLAISLLFATLCFGACSSDSDPCVPGDEACECLSGNVCHPGLYCGAGTCHAPACQVGEAGCACKADYTCDAGEDGVWLQCVAGLCQDPDCLDGALGCACRLDGSCGAGLICEAGRCQMSDCEVGSLDCGCYPERSCAVHETGVQLYCDDGLCVSTGCQVGSEGCLCEANYGCDAGLICQQDRCIALGCEPGQAGCTCLPGGLCDSPSMDCNSAGLCEDEACIAGSEECTCLNDGTCDVAVDGSGLICLGSRCQRPDCQAGALGCACDTFGECDGGGRCTEGWCLAPNCIPGESNCSCREDGACNGGLACLGGEVCVDNLGLEGGACFENRTCRSGYRCLDGLCVACLPGSLACSCDAGVCANGLACLAGFCVAEESLVPTPPADPRCYTPCRQGYTRDGVYVPCDAEGLLEGCIGDNVCVWGSCLAPYGLRDECLEGDCEAPPNLPGCASKSDCPDHQKCIQGHCYSDCDSDSDCDSGMVCERHVCSVPCTSDGAACPDGQFCELDTSGLAGTCQTLGPPSENPSGVVEGGFSLSTSSLTLSAVRTERSFWVFNDSPISRVFYLRKLNHVLYGDDHEVLGQVDGAGTECDWSQPDPSVCALPWLDLSEATGGSTTGEELEFIVNGGCPAPIACYPGVPCPTDMQCGPDSLCLCDGGSCEDHSFCTLSLEVGQAGDRPAEASAYNGVLEVSCDGLGSKRITLDYRETSAGQWNGLMYSFAGFGAENLDGWLDSPRDNDSLLYQVNNAFIKRWVMFRRGVNGITLSEFEALLTATVDETWRWPSVKEACLANYGTEYCYLTEAGPVEYTNEPTVNPIPTGVVELPFVMNLKPMANDPLSMEGKVVSNQTLQMAGDPAVRLTFADAPGACSDDSWPDACLSFVVDMGSPNLDPLVAPRGMDVRVGGRYVTDESDTTCTAFGDTYEQVAVPWLLPGFVPPGYEYGDEAGRLMAPDVYYECRDGLLPYYSELPTELEEQKPYNLSLASANPIPDGMARNRRVELIDGFMVNGERMYLLVRETFTLRLGPSLSKQFSGYGLMVLRRNRSTIDPQTGFAGADYSALIRVEPNVDLLSPTCSPNILNQIPGVTDLDNSSAGDVVMTILQGVAPSGNAVIIYPRSEDRNGDGDLDPGEDLDGDGLITIYNAQGYRPHYFCEDTGLIDGGQYDDGTDPGTVVPSHDLCATANNGLCEDGGAGAFSDSCSFGMDFSDCGTRYIGDARVACPVGSRVVYFLTPFGAHDSQAEVANLPCQSNDTVSCWDTIKQWEANNSAILDTVWRCHDPNATNCSGNRLNLREGKVFYLPGDDDAVVFRPLLSEVDDAFRYKTRFVGRSGGTLGFAPNLCEPDSDAVPYCYDPVGMELVTQRIDCLMDVHANHFQALDPDEQTHLLDFLATNFAYDPSSGREGFERLSAELMIMMGDENLTQAFASRFDLAGSNLTSFDGSVFEPGGINLSGGAGHEMHVLYLATQYYQVVLDRFYSLSPAVWQALEGANNFVTQETVTAYLVKVARASTQKSRAWSEVAKRYQSFDRADLAWKVLERAYTSTYLESVLIARMMTQIMDRLAPDEVPQVVITLGDVQRRYRVALSEMRKVYSQITDDITVFGFPPDYVPFPTLDNRLIDNAFTVLYASAMEKVEFAAGREAVALADNREFETDAEAFQRELATLRTSYLTKLGNVCGTFVGSDGGIYPAIPDYAYLSERAKMFGNPCGLMGNGDLYETMTGVELARINLDGVIRSQEAAVSHIENELQRVTAVCGVIQDTVDFEYRQAGKLIALRTVIRTTEHAMAQARTIWEATRDTLITAVCTVGTSTDCPMAVSVAASLGGAAAIFLTGESLARAAIVAMEGGVDAIERETARFVGLQQCAMEEVESRARVMDMVIDMELLNVDLLRAQYELQLSLSKVDRERNNATALLGEWKESEQLLINVETARNDPNVRIYRNDAIINADISFNDALAEVYRATKVFEYYTSTSYGDREQLFLVRMVRAGDFNLENYLIQLGNAFSSFGEDYGNPDTRVAVLSLRDDILAIPRLDAAEQPFTEGERLTQFRQKLTDNSLLDENGYLVTPFSTSFQRLSPLTRNHKILYIEAELVGAGVGDSVARIYLRQQGTSTIRTVADEKTFFQFPQRTAVVNTFFNGQRQFESLVYKNYRLRDRPFVNSSWEMVFNQKDEYENKDVDLSSIDDVRLYVYYTDFTEM